MSTPVTRLPGRPLGLAIALTLALAVVGCGEDSTLKVTRVSPSTGSYMGGDTVTIHGSGFLAGGVKGATVYFNGRRAPNAEFDGDDKLRVHAPGGHPGEEVDITVVFGDGRSQELKKVFKYVDPRPLRVDDLTKDGEK